jgi:hypothetical protein
LPPRGGFAAPVDGTLDGRGRYQRVLWLAITSLFRRLAELGSANHAVVLNFEPIAALFLAWKRSPSARARPMARRLRGDGQIAWL